MVLTIPYVPGGLDQCFVSNHPLCFSVLFVVLVFLVNALVLTFAVVPSLAA
jgi:hypothetical protein